MTTAILSPIGKGQITIPASWRKKMGIDRKKVFAEFRDGEIIIRALNEEKWDIEKISFNEISLDDQELIQKGRADFRAGNFEKFVDMDEIFSEK